MRILAALIGLLAGLVVAAPAEAAPVRVRVMTFNICGNVCRHGEVEATSSNVAYQVVRRRVTVAFLQEVCYSQFLAIRARVLPHGYRAIFTASETGGGCNDYDTRNGKAFGLALVVRGDITGRITHGLPSPSAHRPEGRALLGTTIKIKGRPVYVVTTHTTPSGPNRTAQLRAVQRYLTPIARTRPVLLGGDLNALPGDADLDRFYSRRVDRGRGVFREVDETSRRPSCRCGAATFKPVPRKIDYVFASRRHFRPSTGSAVGSRWSDHRMLIGEFVLA
jgi:endonuclease/exonuclease/phosphatase family metal-dependent hydrolase